eukprot:TRINITY_DN1203_c0_g1_i2.p2 TRINITY_DN1203_c0_g1~~TRINITY_DN1203_c0_g1_i2.p2  ORF type:complete len:138 (+),score=16.02 TRINITY_DN1203_c0_g1_i2:543-956(+)
MPLPVFKIERVDPELLERSVKLPDIPPINTKSVKRLRSRNRLEKTVRRIPKRETRMILKEEQAKTKRGKKCKETPEKYKSGTSERYSPATNSTKMKMTGTSTLRSTGNLPVIVNPIFKCIRMKECFYCKRMFILVNV